MSDKLRGGTTIAGYIAYHAGNSGSGSGLDADLWDGKQFSDYLNQGVRTTDSPTFVGLNVNGVLSVIGDTYIKFGTGASGSDYGFIQWTGTSNEGKLRIATADDNGTEYIEFGDYDTSSVSSTFTQWLLMNRNTFKWQGSDIIHAGNIDDYVSGLLPDRYVGSWTNSEGVDGALGDIFGHNGSLWEIVSTGGGISTNVKSVEPSLSSSTYWIQYGNSSGLNGGGNDKVVLEYDQEFTNSFTFAGDKVSVVAHLNLANGVDVDFEDGAVVTIV